MLVYLLLYQATCVVIITSQDLTPTVPSFFYPFGPDLGDTIAPVNDDSSTGEVEISIPFPYFDQLHPKIYVNTNGAVSFLAEVSQYTPDAFPLDNNRRLITPFWADVDTTENDGRVYYRETQDITILDRCTADVRGAFVDQTRFQAVWALIVTWYNVTYYGGGTTTAVNTFQVVLITNGRHSFTVFNYGDINWTFGTASDGISAQAGFNAGDGVRYFTIPGSRTSDIINVETTTNVGLPGRWIFRVDEASVVAGGCNTAGALAVGPRYASLLGGKRINVAGPCFNNDSSSDVVCRFDDVVVPAEITDETHAICVVPMTFKLGRRPFQLSIDGGETYNYSGVFWLLANDDDDYTVQQVDQAAWDRGGLYESLVITWKADTLESSTVDVDFVTFSKQTDGSVTTEIVTLLRGAQNSGRFVLSDRLQYASSLTPYSFGAIRVSETKSGEARQSIWSSIHTAQWYTNRYIHETVLRGGVNNNDQRKRRALPDLASRYLDAIGEFVDDTATDVKRAVSDGLTRIRQSVFNDFCTDWYQEENADSPDFEEVGPSPCTLDQATQDPNFVPDPACNMGSGCGFHQGAYHCVRSSQPSPSGGSQQACYDRQGRLLSYASGGGTYDRSHVSGRLSPLNQIVIPYIGHFFDDVLPYMYCCDWSDNCAKYGEVRPTDDCDGYQEPVPAWAAGDPHVTTLDGVDYTFNGVGEFVLLDVNQGSLVVQVRAEQYIHPTEGAVRASVWTAIAMKDRDSDKVQVTVSERLGLEVLINGQTASFDDLPSQQYQGAFVEQIIPSSKFLVRFDSDFAIQIVQGEGSLALLPILNPVYKGKTRGLFGVWDNDKTNDFTTPDGSIVPSTATSQEIYVDFGQTWRTSADTSLFTYPSGKTHADYQNPGFNPLFEPPKTDPVATQRALEICGDIKQCQFDYILTGNENIANITGASALEYNSILEQLAPVITCGFPELPTNGQANLTNGPVGAVVRFVCETGYDLQGPDSRQCMVDGDWSGQVAECIKDDTATENPPAQSSLSMTYIIIIIISSGVIMIIASTLVIWAFVRKKKAEAQKKATESLPNSIYTSVLPSATMAPCTTTLVPYDSMKYYWKPFNNAYPQVIQQA